MTGGSVLERAVRRGGAGALLESFCRTHRGVRARLWVRSGGGWWLVWSDAVGEGGPGPAACTFRAGAGVEVALELAGARVRAAEAEFLGRAVAEVLARDLEADRAAAELADRYEEINLLYSISEILGSVLPLPAAGRRILGEVADVLGARRASLWIYEPADGRLHLVAEVGEKGLAGPVAVDDPGSVTARVFRERQPLNLERGWGPGGSGAAREGEAFLSVPIQYAPPEGEGRTIGVITLVGRRDGGAFHAGDARLLTALAGQVGAALEAHRLLEENVRQQRVLRELELAHDVQLKLLPDASRFAPFADVAARCVPARSVGGDFYHLFRLAGRRLGILLGDVSSHGFAAALIMTMVISAVAVCAQDASPPAEVLRRVDASLRHELEAAEMFVSLFYGVLDPDAGTLAYANAGHPHAFRIRADGGAERLAATAPPLGGGVSPGAGQAAVPWSAGRDLLCLFTDGLSDAFAPGRSAGEAALVAEVVRLRDRPAREILDRLFARATEREPAVPPDDRTALLLRA